MMLTLSFLSILGSQTAMAAQVDLLHRHSRHRHLRRCLSLHLHCRHYLLYLLTPPPPALLTLSSPSFLDPQTAMAAQVDQLHRHRRHRHFPRCLPFTPSIAAASITAATEPSTIASPTPRLTTPHLSSPRHTSIRLTSPASPRLTSHRLASPRLASPHLASPRLTSPHLASPHHTSLLSPRHTSPRLTSPRLASPRLASQRDSPPNHNFEFMVSRERSFTTYEYDGAHEKACRRLAAGV